MKKAFSILELVLAIIIIAIAVASVPALISSSLKTNSQSLLQEAVVSSSAKLSEVTASYSWANSAETTPIVDITNNYKGLGYMYNPRELKVVTPLDPVGTSGTLSVNGDSSSHNILNLNYAISASRTDNEAMFEITTTANNGEAQTIKLTNYSYNIGEPVYKYKEIR
ncbi:hypothetical protein CIG2463D_1207 [Campylobacter iguaniorum]|uniref:hypothetical protein n=1 Tax=Campylobacter iguaniorum TaxID=1244531 RepID=UPI00073A388C|nr:hypothetical protein [Campylobacter iguaniorum]ALV24778.1 hypothetical protein CIG2463D_1207 [Campylobacter iguaniorum]